MNIPMQAVSDVAAFMLQASIKATVLVALVLLIQKAFGRFLSAQGHYLLWLPVIASLVTPVGFGIRLPADMLPPMHTPAAEIATAFGMVIADVEPAATPNAGVGPTVTPVADTLPAQETAVAAPAPVTSRYSATTLLAFLWLAGVLVVLGSVAVASHRVMRLMRRAAPAAPALQSVLDDCMHETRCAARVRLLHSPDVGVPMIAGLFRPVLLLPEDLAHRLGEKQLRHVFIHELMHLQRGDIVANWIVAVVQALHWFNPFVWFAFFRMRQDRELACDAATLRHLQPMERAAYGHTLLQLNDAQPCLRVPALALSMLHDASSLRRRIVMLAESSQHATRRRVAAALLLVPLAALAFGKPVAASNNGVSSADAIPAIADIRAPGAAQAIADIAAASNTAQAVGDIAAALNTEQDIPDVAEGSLTVDDKPAIQRASTAPSQSREPDAVLRRAAPQLENATASTAAPTVLAAVGSAAEAAAPVDEAPAPYDGLPEIEGLAETIAAVKADKLAFIEKWNALGMKCDARKDGFLGALSASCQRIRTAQRRGEIFRFAYECFQLGAIHDELVAQYRSAQQRGLQVEVNLLHVNERDLAAICSEDTFTSQYPAFAAMFADAEALKYYPRHTGNAGNPDRAVAGFGDVFFHQDRTGGNTGLGTGGSLYSPGYPNVDTPVPGIFGSGLPAGAGAVDVPTPAQ